MNVFKKYKMQPLLIVTISSLVLMLLLIQGIIMHHSITNLVSDKIYDNSAEVLEQMNLRIYEKLNDLRQISLSIAMNGDIKNILANEDTQDVHQQILDNRIINNFLSNITNSRTDIHQIVILSDAANAYSYNGHNGIVNKDFIKDKTLFEYFENEGEGFTSTRNNFLKYDSSDNRVIISFRKFLPDNKKNLGIICIVLNEVGLRDILNDYNIEDSNKVTFIVNDRDEIISSHGENNSYIFHDAVQNLLTTPNLHSKEKKPEVMTIDAGKYLTIVTSANPYGWRVVQLLPYNNIGQDISSILRIIIYVGIVFFATAVLFLLYFSKSIIQPIQNLIKQMEIVSSGDFDIPMDTDYTNEIGNLYGGFKGMILKIKQLLTKINYQHQELRRAEFKALQSQINPHFLYNTLDSINWMAINIKAHNISAMVSDLGNLFRLSLNKGNSITLIENEIEHLRCYMNIQAYRYDNKFIFTEQYEPEIFQYSTVNLILQPIIENCLIHGFSKTKGKGEILIRGWCGDKDIFFIISDDGLGVDNLAMNRYLISEAKDSDGYGIRNVDTRIKIQFGYEYGLQYLHTNKGTSVQIRFPQTLVDTHI